MGLCWFLHWAGGASGHVLEGKRWQGSKIDGHRADAFPQCFPAYEIPAGLAIKQPNSGLEAVRMRALQAALALGLLLSSLLPGDGE